MIYRIRILQGNGTIIREYINGLSTTNSITFAYSLTVNEASRITNYNDLRLEFAVLNNLNVNSGDVYFSWAQLQIPKPTGTG